MAADLREMQENQGFSENLIDKLEFVYVPAAFPLGLQLTVNSQIISAFMLKSAASYDILVLSK